MSNEFTPALGRADLTGAYDRTIRFWTREGKWRPMFVAQINAAAGETIIDVGCGTGTLATLLKQAAPGANIIGIDPDPEVLRLAAAKAETAGVSVDFRHGFARDAATSLGGSKADKAVSSLVFHQTPLAEKRAGLMAMHEALKSGGELHVADYGRQPGPLMRALFGIIQIVDGKEDTQPNADGVLTQIIAEVGFADIRERFVRTPTGAISLLSARRL